jgi:uncharacterized protein YjbI with pentapeptide repeats
VAERSAELGHHEAVRRDLGIEPARNRPEGAAGRLTADCARCVGLCCVALPFTKSADFAFDKAAGEPCVNLGAGYGCRVHSRLRDIGFVGCTVYDCFGAGQQVTQVTFAGRSWRADPESAAAMFQSFAVMRQLHELLWYLQDASARAVGEHRHQIDSLRTSTERLAALPAPELLRVDVQAQRATVDPVLQQVSAVVRAAAGPGRRDFRRADLVGRSMRGADLRGADFRGALLLGADLRSADLRFADLIGADLRGARVHGADLSSTLFLTQFQINAASGDERTQLPPSVTRPGHW